MKIITSHPQIATSHVAKTLPKQPLQPAITKDEKNFQYSAALSHYSNQSSSALLSKAPPTTGDGWTQVADKDFGYNRTYASGATHWRPHLPMATMTDDQVVEIALKRTEEIMARMERLKDNPAIGVPKDPIALFNKGIDPYGPDYILPDLVGKSEDELRDYFLTSFFRRRDSEQASVRYYDEGVKLYADRMKAIEDEHQAGIMTPQDIAARDKGYAEDMKKAKAEDQQIVARLASQLEAGQMISAQDMMKFAMIDAGKLAKAMEKYNTKAMVSKLNEHFTAKV